MIPNKVPRELRDFIRQTIQYLGHSILHRIKGSRQIISHNKMNQHIIVPNSDLAKDYHAISILGSTHTICQIKKRNIDKGIPLLHMYNI